MAQTFFGEDEVGRRREVAASFLAILVGIGLSRFAYSPLIPAIISAGWFSPSEAAYLGAANLAGYLLGALLGQKLAAAVSPVTALRGCMLVASAAFFASSLPVSFLWFFVWRLLSGIMGGALMVLAAPFVLSRVPPLRKGVASGFIFASVGAGIVLSGTLVPVFVNWGVAQTWCMLGTLSLLATFLAWFWWPATKAWAEPRRELLVSANLFKRRLNSVYFVYGLVAVGLIPHMIFLVDYITRGLSFGLSVGGHFWVIFGIGALLMPIMAGWAADRIGFSAALLLALLLQMFCVGWLGFAADPFALTISSLVIGGFVSGTVPLVLGRTQELLDDPALQQSAWSVATIVFSIGQAAAGYGYSYLFSISGGNYELLFLTASAVLFFALMVTLDAVVIEIKRSRNSFP